MTSEGREENITHSEILPNKRVEQLKTVQEEALNLFQKKNTDYGDAFASYGPIGVLVRLGDKIRRLENISKTNINLVESEKMRDTLIDLHNYAAMAIMLLDEKDTLIVKNKTIIETLLDPEFKYSNN